MWELFFSAIGQVLLIGVLIGAGLPAIFALGVRSLAYGAGGDAIQDIQNNPVVSQLRSDLSRAMLVLCLLERFSPSS